MLHELSIYVHQKLAFSVDIPRHPRRIHATVNLEITIFIDTENMLNKTMATFSF